MVQAPNNFSGKKYYQNFVSTVRLTESLTDNFVKLKMLGIDLEKIIHVGSLL